MHALIAQSTTAAAGGGGFGFDPLLIGMLALLGLLIFMMFRNNKKRREQMSQLETQMVPGVEVMTNFGLYGTLVAIDDDTNEALIEVSPGTTIRVHRQVLARVVEPETVEQPEHDTLDGDTTEPGENR
ncbi:preprotein translocase subunit YajC [Humidisolicoccus flavus]|uniref:preprotein translocase subunit YajC n=1 Tax=Humidisolicoccus flavus TaxID=3111414 RepID=UPI003254FA41